MKQIITTIGDNMKKMRNERPLVRRITVDERLHEDLIRLEICSLGETREEFKDSPELWKVMEVEKKDKEDEDDWLATTENYADMMGIPQSMRSKWLWKDLREGMVFLSGDFKVVEKDENDLPKRFAFSPGNENFVRIDEVIKDDIARLYYEAVERRR